MTAIAKSTTFEHPVPRDEPPEPDPLEGELAPSPPPELPLDPLTELLMLAKDVPWRRAPRPPP